MTSKCNPEIEIYDWNSISKNEFHYHLSLRWKEGIISYTMGLYDLQFMRISKDLHLIDMKFCWKGINMITFESMLTYIKCISAFLNINCNLCLRYCYIV